MNTSKDKLINYFKKISNIGEKNITNIFNNFIMQNKDKQKEIINIFEEIILNIDKCSDCNNISEKNKLCNICRDNDRDNKQLMVVESISVLNFIEDAKIFNGRYFVYLNEDDDIKKLQKMIGKYNIEKIILLFDPTIDGELKFNNLKDILQKIDKNIKISKPGIGIPVGSKIKYMDPITISNSLKNIIE